MTQGIKTRLAIYGGAFDPIHNGHLATIGLLLSSGQVDKVVVVPSGDRPDKAVNASAHDRFLMTELAVREAFPQDARVVVSDVHAAAKVGYATIDLVEHFLKEPGVEVHVVIGHELIGDLPTWKDSARLCSLAHFLIASRPGSAPADVPKGVKASRLRGPYEAGVLVSSTTVRQLMAEGRSCAGLVPPSVITFCKEQGLYRA